MSIVYFTYDDQEVTNTMVQEELAYWDTDSNGELDADELARLEEGILSEEVYTNQGAAAYLYLTLSGIPDWVYAPEATFLEENPGTTDEGTLEALSYYSQTTGSKTAVDNYLAFVESSGLADTTGLGEEIEDFLSQFEDDDTVDAEEEDDGDDIVSGTFSEVFPEIAPALISMGHAGLVLCLLGGILVKEAVDEVVETGTDVYGDLMKELEDKVDEIEGMDPESITIQLDLQVLNTEISAISTSTTTLANILQTLLEIPDILVQAGFSSEKGSLDTQSFIAQTS